MSDNSLRATSKNGDAWIGEKNGEWWIYEDQNGHLYESKEVPSYRVDLRNLELVADNNEIAILQTKL